MFICFHLLFSCDNLCVWSAFGMVSHSLTLILWFLWTNSSTICLLTKKWLVITDRFKDITFNSWCLYICWVFKRSVTRWDVWNCIVDRFSAHSVRALCDLYTVHICTTHQWDQHHTNKLLLCCVHSIYDSQS